MCQMEVTQRVKTSLPGEEALIAYNEAVFSSTKFITSQCLSSSSSSEVEYSFIRHHANQATE